MKKWLNVDLTESARGRSPADVYAVLTDLEGWPSWADMILAAKWKGEPGWREGGRFAFKPGLGGVGVWLDVAITIVRENEELEWGVTIPGLLEVRHSFAFEADGPNVKIRNRESFAGPLGLVLSMAVGLAIRYGDGKWLGALVARVERGGAAALA